MLSTYVSSRPNFIYWIGAACHWLPAMAIVNFDILLLSPYSIQDRRSSVLAYERNEHGNVGRKTERERKKKVDGILHKHTNAAIAWIWYHLDIRAADIFVMCLTLSGVTANTCQIQNSTERFNRNTCLLSNTKHLFFQWMWYAIENRYIYVWMNWQTNMCDKSLVQMQNR